MLFLHSLYVLINAYVAALFSKTCFFFIQVFTLSMLTTLFYRASCYGSWCRAEDSRAFPFHTGMLAVALFTSCLQNHPGGTLWVWLLTLLGDTVSQKTSHCFGSQNTCPTREKSCLVLETQRTALD